MSSKISYRRRRREPVVQWVRGTLALMAVAPLALLGCGGTDQGFSAYDGLALSRDRVKLVRDETQSVDVRVQLARGESRGTTVTLSAADLPPGVTATFDPPSIVLDDTNVHTSRMSLSAERLAPITQTQVTVVRKGAQEHRKTLSLLTTDFGVYVDVDDTSIRLDPGSSDDVDVVLRRRGNSSGTVEMTLAGDVPDGVGWTLSPGRVLIDADHPRVHVKLSFDADPSSTSEGEETCRVRALKGTNHDESDEIKVHLNAG